MDKKYAYYLLYADGSIQGFSPLNQGGEWVMLPECPYEREYGKWDGKKWIENTAKKAEVAATEEREALIQAEIRKMAEERLISAGKIRG